MLHLTVGIFGDNEFARKLGKKGTCNDIEIYNHGSSDGVFTYVCPNSDKVQPLLQTLDMIDVPAIIVKELTKEIGEIIIAVDCKGFEKGFILTNNPDSIRNFIKGTCLEKFLIMEEDENAFRQEIIKFNIERYNDTDVLVGIDNAFNVKSIGTVILGLVKDGIVKKYDKLMLEPNGKEILIKGIQSQDRDIEHAEAGMRVGLNLKGAEADDIKRGSVICKQAKKGKEFTIELESSKYNKEELKEGIQIFLNIGAQVSVAMLNKIDGNKFSIKTEHELAYINNKCIVASTRGIAPRIIGKGRIL